MVDPAMSLLPLDLVWNTYELANLIDEGCDPAVALAIHAIRTEAQCLATPKWRRFA